MGWKVEHRSWTRGPILQHDGSNNKWYATIWIAPERDVGFLAVANDGSPAAKTATTDSVAALIDLHQKSPNRGR